MASPNFWNLDFDDDYENRWRAKIPARSVRASSALPGSFGHFDDLASSKYESYKTSKLSSSRRGVSEERELSRNESYVPEYTFEDGRKTRLEDLKELTRESGRDGSDLFESGTYKVSIKPRSTESWIRPNNFYYNTNSQSALTSALLEAYQPSSYPDFDFGSYGLNRGGRLGGRPTSSPYYRSPATNYEDRIIPIRREPSVGPRISRDYLASPRDYIPRRGLNPLLRDYTPGPRDYTPEPLDYLPRPTTYRRPVYRQPPVDDEFYKAPSKINRFSKFFHYYIPKHYGGTPMLGGYLLSTGPVDYTWKY